MFWDSYILIKFSVNLFQDETHYSTVAVALMSRPDFVGYACFTNLLCTALIEIVFLNRVLKVEFLLPNNKPKLFLYLHNQCRSCRNGSNHFYFPSLSCSYICFNRRSWIINFVIFRTTQKMNYNN